MPIQNPLHRVMYIMFNFLVSEGIFDSEPPFLNGEMHNKRLTF